MANWRAVKNRERMRAKGTLAADFHAPLFPEPPRPLRPQESKAGMRASTEAALAAYDGTVLKEITCASCGHTGRVRVQLDKINLPFRCSACGASESAVA